MLTVGRALAMSAIEAQRTMQVNNHLPYFILYLFDVGLTTFFGCGVISDQKNISGKIRKGAALSQSSRANQFHWGTYRL
jgi:hypothetical protein